MAAHPRLEVVTSGDANPVEVVSPELALVDPELAARARAQLVLPAPPSRPRPAPPTEDEPAEDTSPDEGRFDVVDRRSASAQLAARIQAPIAEPSAEPPVPRPAVVVQPHEPTPADQIAPRPAARVELATTSDEATPQPLRADRPSVAPTLTPVARTVARPSERAAFPPVPAQRRPGRWRRRLRILSLLLVGTACAAFVGVLAADVWFPRDPAGPAVGPTVPPVAGQAEPDGSTPSGGSVDEPRTETRANDPGEVTSPAFVWVAVPAASRYEVVFQRGGKTVYRATTTLTRLELPRSWRYEGKTYRLTRGRYHWTVWPLVDGKRARRPVVSADYAF